MPLPKWYQKGEATALRAKLLLSQISGTNSRFDRTLARPDTLNSHVRPKAALVHRNLGLAPRAGSTYNISPSAHRSKPGIGAYYSNPHGGIMSCPFCIKGECTGRCKDDKKHSKKGKKGKKKKKKEKDKKSK